MSTVGGRKFVATMTVILGSFLMCWLGKLEMSIAAQLIGTALIVFVGGNVTQDIAARRISASGPGAEGG